MDLFQIEFILTIKDRKTVISTLDTLNGEHAYCSACSSPVETGWLRKHHDTPLNEAVCLPCFLNNFTDASQVDIDRMVALGQENNMYHD
jgi:hypothetical protein